MIECNLGGCGGIYYSPREYAKHLVSAHDKVPKELLDWSKKYLRKPRNIRRKL